LSIAQKEKTEFKDVLFLALDGKIVDALERLSMINNDSLNDKDKELRKEFELRFMFEKDESKYLIQKNSGINDLLVIFRDYWRESFLKPEVNIEKNLKLNLVGFLNLTNNKTEIEFNDDLETLIDSALKSYIRQFNLHTTGFGKTGKFYDLLVWKSEYDTSFSFELHGEKINCPVVFMHDFVTLGWEEYATIGKYYPGGWATKEKLFCVKDAYDLNSENFRISYLAHEGRHFGDYKIFPKLSGADLEYRAKLTELSLLNETMFKVLKHFILNSNYESDNAHSVANFCVIRDLTGAVFGDGFQKTPDRWKSAGRDLINEKAYELLQNNTELLIASGRETERFIKK